MAKIRLFLKYIFLAFFTANNENTHIYIFPKIGTCITFLSAPGEKNQSVHELRMKAIVQQQKLHFKEMDMLSQICKAKLCTASCSHFKQCKLNRNKVILLQENKSILT